jgi:hypothetical protein
MKSLLAITFAVLCLSGGNADAVVTVSEQIMQSGQFVKPDCKSDPKEADYDECTCDADIRYPQLGNMQDTAAQAKLNDWFRQQAAKAICEGTKTAPPTGKDKVLTAKAHASQSVHYGQTYSSPELLAFKFTDWAYTGGAHGNGSVIGVILDLATGKLLTATDIFSGQNMEAVNEAIYKALTAKPEEEIFRDQIEARQGVFIRDGECQGCTLTLTPEGVHVLFQTYEVAPYGAGNTDVLIPTNLVSDPAVKQALAMQMQTTPEKK